MQNDSSGVRGTHPLGPWREGHIRTQNERDGVGIHLLEATEGHGRIWKEYS